jgi:hypothetical protein
VSWRNEGIKHRKNEVFLDVVESVNLLVNASGSVLHSEIVGAVKMRVFLTGMPEVCSVTSCVCCRCMCVCVCVTCWFLRGLLV